MSKDKKKKTIVCIYAFKRRDLFSCALLKYILEKYFDYNVKFVKSDFSYKVLIDRIKFYKPQLVILFNVQLPSQKSVVMDSLKYGYKVVWMPTEVFVGGYTGERFLLNNKEYCKHIEFYFAPGKQIADFIVNNGILPKEKVPVVGYPRFDQYAEPYIDLFSESKENFIKRYGFKTGIPIILWASNDRYPRAFDPLTRKSYINDAETNIKIDGQERVDILCRAHTEALDAVRELVKKYKNKFYLLYRPRYGELVEHYKELFADFTNVFLVHNENLYNLLLYSDLVFHSYSMLGTEAWLYRKPTVTYCFGGAEKYYGDRNKGCEDFVKNKAELFAYIDSFLRIGTGDYFKKYIDNQRAYLNGYYYNINGLATMRIARYINELFRQTEINPNYKMFTIGTLKQVLKHILGLEEFQSLFWFKNKDLNAKHNANKFIYTRDMDSYFSRLDGIRNRMDKLFAQSINEERLV